MQLLVVASVASVVFAGSVTSVSSLIQQVLVASWPVAPVTSVAPKVLVASVTSVTSVLSLELQAFVALITSVTSVTSGIQANRSPMDEISRRPSLTLSHPPLMRLETGEQC